MHHAALVRVGQRVDDVVQDAHDVTRGEPMGLGERAAQRLALDIRHREPQQPVVITGGQQRYDVRML